MGDYWNMVSAVLTLSSLGISWYLKIAIFILMVVGCCLYNRWDRSVNGDSRPHLLPMYSTSNTHTAACSGANIGSSGSSIVASVGASQEASVGASSGASVGASSGASREASVGASSGASREASVGASRGASVGASRGAAASEGPSGAKKSPLASESSVKMDKKTPK